MFLRRLVSYDNLRDRIDGGSIAPPIRILVNINKMKERITKIFIMLAMLVSGPFLYAQYPTGGPPPGSGQGGPGRGETPQAGYRANGYGKITGTVLDAATKEGVPYVTVALLDPETMKPLDGTVGNEKGEFSIKNIPAGTYTVSVSFLGYEKIEKTGVNITDKGNTVDFGILSLSSETKQLDEVVVQSQRALIVEKVDRTIYNAENDQTTKGGDATDVLRRVPMLSVDLDGNVSLRGSQNIRVLIDNRPSTIAATSVADALKQIPADQIKSVEVITSPSAKYDAEGTGGIINIITKKNNLQGGSLGIDAGAGLRGSNLGLNGTLRRGRLGLSLGGFGRTGYNIKGKFENEQTVQADGSQITSLQKADTRSDMLFGRFNFGVDYDINKYNWVSASVQYGTFNFANTQEGLLTQTWLGNSLLNQNTRDVEMTNLSGTVDLNLNYTRTFVKPSQELSVMGLYSRNNRTNDFVNDILNEDTHAIMSRLKNENESFNQEITVQADYINPIGDGEKHLIEFGAKNIFRNVTSDFQYYEAGPDGDFVAVNNRALGNVFDYDQNVTAGYVSYTLNFLENYSIKPGLRYEYTTITANFQDEEEVEIPSYGLFAPSLNLSRKLKGGNMVKAAYNRRVQRPSLQFLNPNLQASNPLNITQGNPELEPEYTNNYELSYSTFFKNTSLNLSTFMRNTSGSIQPVRTTIGQDTVLTTYENIGQEDAYGLSIFANLNLNNKFTLNGGIDAYYAVLDNNVPNADFSASNEGLVFSGRLFGNYTFAENWGLQFFGFYRGKQIQLQGYQTGFYIYSLSLKRDFNNGKGSIGIGAENFLSSATKMRSEIKSPMINQSSINEMNNMNFKVNFSYRIGKLSTDPRPRRSRRSIQNTDLKEAESNTQPEGGVR